MEGISPSDLNIDSLIDRVRANKIDEIILAQYNNGGRNNKLLSIKNSFH